MRGTISSEIAPPNGIRKTVIRPSTNARATASAASASTLVSLNAFIAQPPSVSAGMHRKRLLNLPAPVLPGSGSTGRCLLAPSQPLGSPVNYELNVSYPPRKDKRLDHRGLRVLCA